MAARTCSRLLVASCLFLGALVAIGCDQVGTIEGQSATVIGSSGGAAWFLYGDPYAGTPMAGTPNPIATTLAGNATAWDMGGKTLLKLEVWGLPPNRAFGSHLHKLACDDMKAGGHYQNNMWPAGSSANDPNYANMENEAWLDFSSDATGKAAPSPQAMLNWVPRAGQAKAIVIHQMGTLPGGIAGPKLACLPMTF
jgi:hypothetical protein